MTDKYKIGPIPGFYTGEMLGSYPEVDSKRYKTLTEARKKAFEYAVYGKCHVFSPAGYKEGNRYIITHYFSRGYAVKKYGKVLWVTTPDNRWILRKDGTLGKKV